ncbi:MAG: hypothetical protein Q4P24_03760, partial [Rhodobacterales bacterium]|nr:hypothetical protein [Rhodobacterales bacterium]
FRPHICLSRRESQKESLGNPESDQGRYALNRSAHDTFLEATLKVKARNSYQQVIFPNSINDMLEKDFVRQMDPLQIGVRRLQR